MRSLIELIGKDAFRYTGRLGSILFCYRHFPGFRFTFWMRITRHFSRAKHNPLFVISYFFFSRAKYKYGIDIPYTTEIGEGFYIGHFGGIVVSPAARIGRNVNISQGVTIGARYRDGRVEAPFIGNSVYMAPGAKIVGRCDIESGCVIGPNAVVVRSQPPNAVVVGIPGRAIKFTGSSEYCVNEV